MNSAACNPGGCLLAHYERGTPCKSDGLRQACRFNTSIKEHIMIKMVFSDLDGTFLTPEKTISDKNSRMMGALHERGILAALQSHEFEPGGGGWRCHGECPQRMQTGGGPCVRWQCRIGCWSVYSKRAGSDGVAGSRSAEEDAPGAAEQLCCGTEGRRNSRAALRSCYSFATWPHAQGRPSRAA